MTENNNNKSTYVSCQVLGQIFVYCEQKGVPVDPLVENIPYTREFIETPSNFIDWDSLVEILNQAAMIFSEEEILELAAVSYQQPMFLVYRLIGRLRFTLHGFYHYMLGIDGLATRFYPVQSTVISDDALARNITFRIDIMPGLAPCKVFFQVLEGQARGISEVMGYDRSEVEATYFEHGLELSIDLPRETGWFSAIRRTLTNPLSLIQTAKALQETHDELVERNRQLVAEKRQLVAAQAIFDRQQEQLNLLANTTPVLLWSVNMEFQTLYCSPSVERLLGYTREEAMQFTPLIMLDEESQELTARLFQHRLKEYSQGNPVDSTEALRLRHKRKDGTTFWSENYLTFTRDADGNLAGIVGASIDIDDQVRKDEYRSRLEGELNRASRQELVGKVAGGIAHDFNNALQSIIGFSELTAAQLGDDNPELAQYQQHILRSATSASDLVRQLLAFSSQQTLAMHPVDLGAWAAAQRPMLNSLLGGNIALTIEFEEDLVVLADPGELERVVINLVLNARDAMPEGGQVSISIHPCSDEELPANLRITSHRYARFSVRDTGTGVNDAFIDRIFDPYFTMKPDGVGSGLGLAVSAGIIEQHNGHISAHNAADKTDAHGGLQVDVYLQRTSQPIHKPDNDVMHPPASLRNLRVLVADDQPVISDLVRSILEAEHATVLLAADGAEAVSVFTENAKAIDLVLIDVVMPGMSGDKAAALMHEVSPGTPIIFMTGYAGDHAALNSLADQTVLAKPFSRSALISSIKETLAAH